MKLGDEGGASVDLIPPLARGSTAVVDVLCPILMLTACYGRVRVLALTVHVHRCVDAGKVNFHLWLSFVPLRFSLAVHACIGGDGLPRQLEAAQA